MGVYDLNGNDLSVVVGGKTYLGNMKPNNIYTLSEIATISTTLSNAQGMAITGNTLVMLFNGGGIVLYDLVNKTQLGQYMMACAGESNHCNSASFSTEMGTSYPLLYVSECRAQHRCFVEDIGLSSSTTVQTIAYDNANNNYNSNAFDWILDEQNHHIMTYGISGSKTLIKAFDLPETSIPEVTFSESDKLYQWYPDDFAGEFLNTYQGNTVYGNILYLPVSNDERIFAFDKTSHALIAKIDLEADYPSIPELEDVAVYGDKLIVSTNNKKLYEICLFA